MGKIKRSERKGFTVAELLIVVAIIAVLVAISIPVINKGLEKSREAYDIYTMRQAASAAIDLYYAGVTDATSAAEAGLSWSNAGGSAANNAYGAYNPKTGTFVKSRDALPADVKTYGKGTPTDGGTTFILGNDRGAYAPGEDYRNAVVMVAIYPNASPARVDVYWKNNISGNTLYVGGQFKTNIPNNSISIILE